MLGYSGPPFMIEGKNVSPLLLLWDGLILPQVPDVSQPQASMRWEPRCVWQPTNTRAFITPSVGKPAVWKINIDDLVKRAARERGRTNNDRLCQCRQPGSPFKGGHVLLWWGWSCIPVAQSLTSIIYVSKRIWDSKHRPSHRSLGCLLNGHADAKELSLAECLGTNIWCKAEVTFGVQSMKADAQHAKLSNIEITFVNNPSMSHGVLSVSFLQSLWDLGTRRELFKGKFKKSGFIRQVPNTFQKIFGFFGFTLSILVICLNIYLKCPLVINSGVSEGSPAKSLIVGKKRPLLPFICFELASLLNFIAHSLVLPLAEKGST